MKKITAAIAGVSLLALGATAIAQIVTPTQVTQINPGDLFQDIPNGVPATTNVYAPAPMLGNYSASLAGNNPENALIGGDMTTNLFQRGTTGSNVTTTLTYGGPDRWFAWDGGTGTQPTVTLSRDSTAADIPSNFLYSASLQRTSGQTGLAQVCAGQVVESLNAYQFQGQTAEYDVHLAPGATFSAASGNVTLIVSTGTVADEGAVNMAYGINTGGGGSGGWTGQVNWSAVVPVTALARRTIAAPVGSTVKEIGVSICWTPVGTAGASDYVAFTGAQLVRNSALTGLVAANASGTASALAVTDTRAKSFSRRSAALETVLQQRYYYQILEAASSTALVPGVCAAQSTTVAVCSIPLKVTMRTAPTITCTPGTFKRQVAGTDTAVSACGAAATTNGVSTADTVGVTATVASGDTAGLSGVLMGGNSTGAGKITASSEL